MESRKIILMSVLAAVAYGIVHDQITARLCLEYFTVAHPPMVIWEGTDSPTLVALYWGVAATWWVGLILGLGLAVAARAGKRPKMTAGQLLKPVGILLGCMFGIALIAGLIGYIMAADGIIQINPWLAKVVPPERHLFLIANGAAHLASYITGGLGGIALWIWTWRHRRCMEDRRTPNSPKTA